MAATFTHDLMICVTGQRHKAKIQRQVIQVIEIRKNRYLAEFRHAGNKAILQSLHQLYIQPGRLSNSF